MSRRFALVHVRSRTVLASVIRAEGLWALGWGVILWRDMPTGAGLWLPGVSSVHTAFVRWPLDLLFLDSKLRTIRAVRNVPPWRLLVDAAGASHTIELAAGTLSDDMGQRGDLWRLEEATASSGEHRKVSSACVTM